MSMLGSRLNTARFTSVLADIQTQFPISGSLTAAEQAGIASDQSKLAHALTDHEGTDVVAEITGHAAVSATGTDPQGGTVTSTGTVA